MTEGGEMASQEWHWEQGNKYAVEGIKTTLLLNGTAAIALMTFATNTQRFSSLLLCPLLSFAGGAMFSVFAFVAAYMAQLVYGNAKTRVVPKLPNNKCGEEGSAGTWAHSAQCC
jgi:hypothetical protein